MTTQYTTILKLALPVQGELSGTWGDVVNDNITQMVEQAVAGKAVVNTWTGNSHTLTTADGTTSESRCAILELTDSGTALTGAGTVVCPTNTKLYIVDNNTAEIYYSSNRCWYRRCRTGRQNHAGLLRWH
jgi:Tfp pilus assembly protein PilV